MTTYTKVKDEDRKETCPQNAGEKNVQHLVATEVRPLTEPEIIGLDIQKKCTDLLKSRNFAFKTSAWTEEEFAQSTNDLLEWCEKNEVGLSPALLRLWYSTSKQTISDWRNNPDKYFQGKYLNSLYELMEMEAYQKCEKYPVGNIFKLKSVHGFMDTPQTVVVTNNMNSVDDVKELVSKMQLNKVEQIEPQK